MKSIFLVIITTFLSLNIYSQSKTVMIKSVETYGSFMSIERNLYIIDNTGKTFEIPLEKHNKSGIPQNMLTIKTNLDKYLNEGYEIVSSTSNSFGENGVYTIENTYILILKE